MQPYYISPGELVNVGFALGKLRYTLDTNTNLSEYADDLAGISKFFGRTPG
jgi:hypothetical protein